MGKKENWLRPHERENVIRETFEAITAIGFTKWKAEELMAYGYEVGEEDRKCYFAEFKKAHFPDFQKMAETAPDNHLLDMRADWIERANAMGLKEWQEVLSAGQGAKPWYEALEREIAMDAQFRHGPGEHADRNSVLGYKLPEPCPEPSPQQEQSKDRTHGR